MENKSIRGVLCHTLQVSPFQDGAISHNLSTGQDSASTDAAEQVIVNLALPLIKEPTTPGSNNLTATHAAAAANGTAGILHASLWPEEVGRPLPKPVTWPLEMSAVGTPVLASPVLASGSAFEAPTPARGTEAQFSSGTSDVGAREPQHTLLPTPRIPPGAVQHTHFADVVKSAQLDLERSDDSTSAACALLKAAFQWPPAPEPLVSPASEGSDVPVGAQNPQQSHRRPLGSTQVTSYSRQVAEGVGQWGVSTATLEEEAATLEAWAEGDGAEEMEGLEHDEVANEEAWREYWLQYYDYYGHFPGGSPHDLNGPVTPAAGAAGRPHGGEYDEGQEGEGAMTPWGPVQQDEGAYVRVSVRLLQRYQELEAQAGRQPSPGS